MVMNWTALIFGSSTNFIIPLLLYISSKTYFASTAETGGSCILLRRQEIMANNAKKLVIYLSFIGTTPLRQDIPVEDPHNQHAPFQESSPPLNLELHLRKKI